jgi:hypothetical protein
MTMNTIEAVSVRAAGPALLKLSTSLDNASTALARPSACPCALASKRGALGDLGKRIQIANRRNEITDKPRDTEDIHNSMVTLRKLERRTRK